VGHYMHIAIALALLAVLSFGSQPNSALDENRNPVVLKVASRSV